MVAHVLRLKLSVLANAFRRPRRQALGMAVALIGATGFATLLIVVAASLATEAVDSARAVMIVIGALIVLGYAILPLALGADDQLEPGRFVWFGIPTGRLAVTLALGALASLTTLALVGVAIAHAVVFSRTPEATLVTIISIPLIVATCILLGRISASMATLTLWKRRARDAAGVAVLGVVVILATALTLLATLDWGSHALPIVRRIAAVLTWTPLGAVWSIGADAAEGRSGDAWAKAAIAVAFLALLAAAWRFLVAVMVSARRRPETQRTYLGLGWFGRLPATPFGAIAARSLSYWARDSRYLVGLAIIPIVPIVVVLALIVAGVPVGVLAWIPVPLMCLFLGWAVHNDVAHDSSAYWLHLSTSTPGVADRWGRVIPPLLVGVPLALVGSIVSALVAGNIVLALPIGGVAFSALLGALGVASVTSAAFPYAAVRPGDSPFAQPQLTGPGGAIVQTVAIGLPALLTLPVVWVGVIAGGTLSLAWVTIATGLGIGLLVLTAGIAWGGAVIDRRSPELLEFTLQN